MTLASVGGFASRLVQGAQSTLGFAPEHTQSLQKNVSEKRAKNKQKKVEVIEMLKTISFLTFLIKCKRVMAISKESDE